MIEYHPSFRYTDDVFKKFKPEDKQKLHDDRAQYKRARTIKALAPYHHATYPPQGVAPLGIASASMHLRQSAPTLPPFLPPSNTSISSNSTSTPSSYASIMGGRNSQAAHKHYQGGRPT